MSSYSIDGKYEFFVPQDQIFGIAIKKDGKYVSWAICEQGTCDGDIMKNMLKVWLIFTEPKYRRKGYASQLIDLMKRENDEIMSNAFSINEEGAKAFIKNGFEYKRAIHKKGADELKWTKKHKKS